MKSSNSPWKMHIAEKTIHGFQKAFLHQKNLPLHSLFCKPFEVFSMNTTFTLVCRN